MRVALDARWILPEISGIGLYTRELIRALATADADNEYVLLFDSAALRDRTVSETGIDRAPNFSTRLVGCAPFAVASQVRVPRLLASLGIDVFHSTNFMAPLFGVGSTRRVITIHDVIPLVVPDHAPRSKKSRLLPLYRGLMRGLAKRAERIIVVSEATRRDVLQHLAIPSTGRNRVIVVHQGVREEFRPATREWRDERLILFVGRRDPYKNLPMLVESLAMLRGQGMRVGLRVVGPPDDRYPEAPELARKLGVNDAIDWVGYVDPQHLIREYQQADVLCLPSRYEGFGLTVLEAMACGTPVVCSDRSSLPEVVDDAAILFDPSGPDRLAQALAMVLADPVKAEELRARGLERAAQFTWIETARRTIDVYRSAMSGLPAASA